MHDAGDALHIDGDQDLEGSHVLDPSGLSPRMLRSTRLIDLVNPMDAKLVAAAFGMHPESVMIYLADHIDEGHLTAQPEQG
ncbi:hypothetical protein GCM10022419_105290 [Nonomuraea rosea]|uniref:FAD:protein FMN transferase n=1 Tax=Nonomuraea rosea TaxID=638574 RepID=A0ABP6ZG58_9ACTN